MMYREEVRPEVERLAWAMYECRECMEKVKPEVEKLAWAMHRSGECATDDVHGCTSVAGGRTPGTTTRLDLSEAKKC